MLSSTQGNTTTGHRRLKWPKLQQVEASSRGEDPQSTRVEFQYHEAECEIQWPAKIDPSKTQWRTEIGLGTDKVTIWSEKELVDKLLALANYSVTQNQIPACLFALIVELLLAPFDPTDQSPFDGPILVNSHSKEDIPSLVDSVGIATVLDKKGTTLEGGIVLTADPMTTAKVVDFLHTCVSITTPTCEIDKPHIEKLAMDLSLRGPSFSISYDELSALEVGGGLMLPNLSTPIETKYLFVNNWKSANVSFSNGHLKMITEFAFSEHSNLNNKGPSEMSKTNIKSILTDVPISLSIELARKTMPLSELKKIHVGDVVPFDTGLPSEVLLLANDAAFAKAELVQIGERLALRLTAVL